MSLKTLPRVPVPRYTQDQRNLQVTIDTLTNNINRLAADAQSIDRRLDETARSVASVGGETNYPVPPAPTGLQATGLFQSVVLSWSAGVVEGFAYTEIWRNDTDNRGTATFRGTSRSMVFSDSAQEGQTYFYWIRHVNLGNVAGPWNDVDGVSASTSISAATVLEAIEGGLTEIHLASALAGRIDLIDTPTTGILARLGVTEDELYNPTSGILALHDSLSDVVTDPVTGLPTRASQADLDSLSSTVTHPTTGLTARALQSDLLALEADVDGKASLIAFNSLSADVYDGSTGLSTRASQSDLTSLSTTVDGKAEASTVNQLALDIGDLDTEVGGVVTQISTIQGDINGILAEWAVQVVTDTADGAIMSGISLMNGGGTSTFQVLADNLAIWDPGPNYAIDNTDKALVIGYTGGQLGIDGAYMRAATIDDASIISLNVEKLVAGTLEAGTWIKGGDFFGAQLRLGVGGVVRPNELSVNTGYSAVIDSDGTVEIEGTFKTGSSGERFELTSDDNRLTFYGADGFQKVVIGTQTIGGTTQNSYFRDGVYIDDNDGSYALECRGISSFNEKLYGFAGLSIGGGVSGAESLFYGGNLLFQGGGAYSATFDSNVTITGSATVSGSGVRTYANTADVTEQYRGSSAGTTSFPIGHEVMMHTISQSANIAPNAAVTVYLTQFNAGYSREDGTGHTALQGTWRCRGTIPLASSGTAYKMQRTS